MRSFDIPAKQTRTHRALDIFQQPKKFYLAKGEGQLTVLSGYGTEEIFRGDNEAPRELLFLPSMLRSMLGSLSNSDFLRGGSMASPTLVPRFGCQSYRKLIMTYPFL